jgi:hypothetical protein
MNKGALLRYHLTALALGTIVFQVVEQDERVTNYLDALGGSYTAPNGWRIQRDKSPEIDVDKKIIFLRGSDSCKDQFVDQVNNMNPKAAEAIVKAIDSALESFVRAAKNYEVPNQPTFETVFMVDARFVPVLQRVRNHACFPKNVYIVT